ncbi:MAG: hypothetical protein UF734_14855 [Clostridium sp.]|nr:hypothetical protein [Clostridium sp.]
MKIETATLHEIQFNECAYTDALYCSLKRIGQNFPIHVKRLENGYRCVDGAKRLNAIQQILSEDPMFPKFQQIRILVVETARTAPPYHLHNHH